MPSNLVSSYEYLIEGYTVLQGSVILYLGFVLADEDRFVAGLAEPCLEITTVMQWR